jgi:hypothetical protein
VNVEHHRAALQEIEAFEREAPPEVRAYLNSRYRPWTGR